MIDEKKIEEAAVEQLENLGTYGLDEVDLGKEQLVALYREEDVKAMFRAGINWFKENLWHDASEEPKEGLKLIVEMTNEECHSACRINEWYYISDVNRECEVSVKADSIYRWLYIEDLMKGGK